jgi:small subunit ribosomal protein S18b
MQQSLARLCSSDCCSSVEHHLHQHKPHATANRIPALTPSIILPKQNQSLHLVNHKRLFSISRGLLEVEGSGSEGAEAVDDQTEADIEEDDNDEEGEGQFVEKYYDPKDRTRKISPELSIKYMESTAYRVTYGDDPVWKHYRRNVKASGQWMQDTREKCIRYGRVNGASPCPICRDMYLVIDYRNTKLLHQFIDKYSGVVYATLKTGLCQDKMERLMIQIEKAKDYGLLDLDATQVYYNENTYKQ